MGTNKDIPFFDHRPMHHKIEDEILNAVNRVLTGNTLVLGNEVSTFEAKVKTYCSCSYAIGVNSGLDALIIALRALGIGEGHEVIVPSNTYIATWMAVSMTGAIPVPVEPNESTFNLDARLVEKAITHRTKAILPVHLYGLPCEMEVLSSIASKYDLFIVEDNAQAFGANYQNKKTSSLGHINATSFYPTKNLGAIGDAGMITTNDESLYQKCKMLRNYGSTQRYYNEVLGYNSRLDEIQAAILNVKIKYLDEWNSMRKSMANFYIENLSGIGDLIMPIQHEEHVYHLFCIRTQQREKLINHLTERGIATVIHYPVPPHLQQCYSALSYAEGDFPIAEKLAKQCLSLPLYIGMEENQIKIVEAIKDFFSN